jgi:hypothetical protein
MTRPHPIELDEQAGTERKRAEELALAVGASVMKVLGRPEHLFRVSAVRLWANQYRVNVQTGVDAVSVRIAHSYFVSTDENGKIIESVPPIARCY